MFSWSSKGTLQKVHKGQDMPMARHSSAMNNQVVPKQFPLKQVLILASHPQYGLLYPAQRADGNWGCLPFSQKIRKFRFEVKWKGNFPENLFGNCGQPPEVVHFFRSERNLGNALTICQIE